MKNEPQKLPSLTKKRNLFDYFSSVERENQQQEKKICLLGTGIPGGLSEKESLKSSTTPFSTFVNKSKLRKQSFGEAAFPPGLEILPEFVTPLEEQCLITFLDKQKWRMDLSRRVIHYGGTYCHLPPRNATTAERLKIESTIYTADPIPSPEFDFVIERMIERSLYRADSRPQYCIVNSYMSNNGISAHVENFRFDEPVCGLTLLNGDWMRFHELVEQDDGSVRSGKAARAQRTGRRIDVWMPRRSLLVMKGDARMKWQHEIVRSRRDRIGGGADDDDDNYNDKPKNHDNGKKEWRRVSLTFRTIRQSPL